MSLYRVSGAFLEFPEVLTFRSFIDRRVASDCVGAIPSKILRLLRRVILEGGKEAADS
jgi:hypothetical protein